MSDLATVSSMICEQPMTIQKWLMSYAERLAVAVFHFHASFCILVGIIHLTICEICLTAVHRQPVNPSLVIQFEMLVQTLEMFQGI